MKLTNRVLKNRAKPVDFKYPLRNEIMSQDMIQFMRAENGIGLAASQIGISRRVFVMEIDGRQWACFNPEIVQSSEIIAEFNEGCLSFKGDSCIIRRPESISVRYQNHRGEWMSEILDGLAARCFQHELDHLDGVTMWDRYKEQHAEQSGN
jgi:peptide deformylase